MGNQDRVIYLLEDAEALITEGKQYLNALKPYKALHAFECAEMQIKTAIHLTRQNAGEEKGQHVDVTIGDDNG